MSARGILLLALHLSHKWRGSPFALGIKVRSIIAGEVWGEEYGALAGFRAKESVR